MVSSQALPHSQVASCVWLVSSELPLLQRATNLPVLMAQDTRKMTTPIGDNHGFWEFNSLIPFLPTLDKLLAW